MVEAVLFFLPGECSELGSARTVAGRQERFLAMEDRRVLPAG